MAFGMDKMSVFLQILMLSLVACSQHSEPTADSRIQAQDTWKLICVGDGFTAGVGVQPDEAYPAQLSALLSDAERPVKVVNAAIKGETIADFGERLDWLLQQRFDAMLLVYGMEQAGAASEERWEDWANVVERIKAVQPRATIWIGTDKPQQWKDLLNTWPEGRGKEIGVVDVALPAVEKRPRLWSEGYPSRQGHGAVARRLAGVFLPLLSGN